MSSYPRNSSFIDLRSRIRTPKLKTQQILSELESMRRPASSSVSDFQEFWADFGFEKGFGETRNEKFQVRREEMS